MAERACHAFASTTRFGLTQALGLTMPEPRNIQIFQELTARFLERLYGTFPNPILLDSMDIGQVVAEHMESDQAEQWRILNEDSANTMEFLAREGFVVFRPDHRTLDQHMGIFPEAALTLKGFTLLGATPDAVNEALERRPIAQQLSEALDAGAKDTVSDLVKKLFYGAMAVGTQALAG